MTESINAAPVPAAQTNGTHAELTPAPDKGQQASYLSQDEAKALFQEMLNPIASTLRRMGEAKQQQEPKQTTAEKTLAERIASLEADKQRFSARKRSAAIVDAGREAGIPPSRLKAFTALVEADAGSRIQYDDEMDSALWVDDLDQKKPISEFVTTFLKTDAGEMFKPATQVPAARGLKATGAPLTVAGARQVTRDDLANGRVSVAEIKSGKVTLVD